MRHLLIVIVCASVALGARPAAAANKDIERLYVQVAALQSQIADLQRTADESQREVKRLTDLLARQAAENRTAAQRWHTTAQQAVVAGDDTLARRALARKAEHGRLVAALATETE